MCIRDRPFYGVVILCSDDPSLQNFLPKMVKRYITYGLKKLSDGRQPDVFASDVVSTGHVSNFASVFEAKNWDHFG